MIAKPITPRNFSLYIHLPWCIQKCPYCDFNSHAVRGSLPESLYIQRLKADLDHDLETFEDLGHRSLRSIFFGGGTPSLFSGSSLQSLLAHIDHKVHIPRDTEITLEANPGAVERQAFQDYRQIGINRLSIGVQSFHDTHLQALGRIHHGQDAIHAVHHAHQSGFQNINIDLMFGLPQQTVDHAMHDLKQATALKPTHMSWYQLTIEPNTAFHHRPPKLPDPEQIWAIQKSGQSYLAQAGFHPYEISAYAQPGYACQHNLHYWHFGDYLGIGAGAHSKITQAGQVIRRFKTKHPKHYLSTTPGVQDHRVVAPKAIAFEFLLNRFRLTQPLRIDDFEEKTGLSIQFIAKGLDQAQERQFLTRTETHCILTDLGQRFLNDVLELFL